jgi:hypothetical protein
MAPAATTTVQRTHHVWVFLLIYYPSLLQLDVQILINTVQHACYGKVVFKLHCHLHPAPKKAHHHPALAHPADPGCPISSDGKVWVQKHHDVGLMLLTPSKEACALW